ncbi:MAG: DUF1015 domain-containing protein [Fimbriimonadales bacterium]|nr:DUF1015 domain-containing protein [Fimbriimonadales bacterium]
MATIRPFRGLRFTPQAGPIDQLVAPPYDVLTPEERDAFAAKNPHNIVHLTLPEQKPDDRSKYVKYARSAALLADWRRNGVLAPEAEPVLYRYVQTFSVPGADGPLARTSVIALLKTEPYEKGVVLPHEQTFPKHKEDRLRLLEATRAHLECIFGLYEDPGARLFDAVRAAPAEKAADVTTEDGVRHELQPIRDPEAIRALVFALDEKKVWIADGHHRYETACAFRAQLGERPGLVAEDFLMMALSSMSDPGLALLPTHRTLRDVPLTADEVRAKLGGRFEVRDVAKEALLRALEEAGAHAFGIVLPGGAALLATLREPERLGELIGGEGSLDLKSLDVTILHSMVLEELLGVRGLDRVGYTRNPEEALRAPEEGCSAAFLMNPPSVDDMRRIALGGEKMPQKSTFYYPKILSGLVLWSLSDFDA